MVVTAEGSSYPSKPILVEYTKKLVESCKWKSCRSSRKSLDLEKKVAERSNWKLQIDTNTIDKYFYLIDN